MEQPGTEQDSRSGVGGSTRPKASDDAGPRGADVSLGGVAGFGIGLIVALLCSFLLMERLFIFFERRQNRQEARSIPSSRVKEDSTKALTPILRGAPGSVSELQDPKVEMEQLRIQEEIRLQSWEWLDRERDRVRIPIEHAKDLIIREGLLSRRRPDHGQQ